MYRWVKEEIRNTDLQELLQVIGPDVVQVEPDELDAFRNPLTDTTMFVLRPRLEDRVDSANERTLFHASFQFSRGEMQEGMQDTEMRMYERFGVIVKDGRIVMKGPVPSHLARFMVEDSLGELYAPTLISFDDYSTMFCGNPRVGYTDPASRIPRVTLDSECVILTQVRRDPDYGWLAQAIEGKVPLIMECAKLAIEHVSDIHDRVPKGLDLNDIDTALGIVIPFVRHANEDDDPYATCVPRLKQLVREVGSFEELLDENRHLVFKTYELALDDKTIKNVDKLEEEWTYSILIQP